VIKPLLDTKGYVWNGLYANRRGIGALATAENDALAAKGLLRHSDLATTTKHYVKDVPSETRLAMAAIEQRVRELQDKRQLGSVSV